MPGGSRRSGRRAAALAAVTVVLTSAGCGTGHPSIGSTGLASGGMSCVDRVTPDCAAYTYASPRPGTVIVTAPRTGASNNREFFWGPTGPSGADQTVCATFATGRGADQQGVVLRLRQVDPGQVTGITVTRNVWMGAYDVFNFHVWDTRAGADRAFRQFGSTVVPTLPVAPAVYPLRLCARTVASTGGVQFVVWRPGRPRPAWGSPTGGGQATLPPGAPASGRGGWFAGHLRPGTSMTYTGLSVDGIVPSWPS